MTRRGTVLVIGATGGIGGAVATALLRDGWRVRGLARDLERAARGGPMGIEWVHGDAMSRADVVAAAAGCAVVFHGANPPGYRDWRGLAVPMLANAIAAAEAGGARLVYPGNLYVYGPDAGGLVGEDAPQHPLTRKGRIRVEMEAMIAAANGRGLPSLIVRAGDFFGPHAPSSWVTSLLLRGGRSMRRVVTPEVPGAAHAWAYLPDLAQTIARLLAREPVLAAAERVHFAGHALHGRAMAEAVGRAVGGHPAVVPFRWLPVILGAPFVTFLREVLEMRYLWRTSLHLDNRRLVAMLGSEPHTALDAAVRACLDAAPSLRR